jgi:hypothetical protein
MRTILTVSLLALAAGAAVAQPRGMGPDDSFNRLLSSYQGTGDVLDYSRVSAESRDRYNRFASFSNSEPMPVSGTITRAQYAEAFNKRMEAMRANGGGFGGPRSLPAPPSGTATATIGGAPPAAPAERTVSDEEVARMMRRYDKNDDGRVSAEEAQSTERLKYVFAHYDANKDGFVDMAEMRVYTVDRVNNRVPEPPGGGDPRSQPPGGQPYYSYDQGGDRRGSRDTIAPPAEEERPVAVRFGKLPKDLPSWWTTLDTDKDGQVGLYEWRADKRAISEFATMDLNGDGLLTAEEYLRFKKLPVTSEVKADATATGKDGRSSRDSRGGEKGGETSKDVKSLKPDRKDDRRDSGKGGNPFREK